MTRQRPELDATDRAILEELWRDARMSNRQIASRLGVSEGTVRSRIRRLTEEKRIRITAIRNIEALERPISAMVGIEVEPTLIHQRHEGDGQDELPLQARRAARGCYLQAFGLARSPLQLEATGIP